MVQELIGVRNLGEHFLNDLAHEMILSLYLQVNVVKGDILSIDIRYMSDSSSG